MTSRKVAVRWAMRVAGIPAMAVVALSGCTGAAEGEITGSEAQALHGAGVLSDAEAREAVRAVCAGSYDNRGRCVSCVAHALNDLKAQGQITGAQHGALMSQIDGSECSAACVPTSCAILGKNCGQVPDGCGGTLECGGCPGLLSCGAGGTPNVCGCAVAPEVCDGVDRNCDGRWDAEVPSVCPTIQSALDVATLPGTIRVAPGVYHENVSFKGAPVTVLATGGASLTTIDAGLSGPAVTIDHSEGPASILDGFTLTNGSGAPGSPVRGGGLYVSGSSPTLRNLVVTGNSLKSGIYDSGGGAYITLSDVTIERSVFTGNEVAYYGGGLYVDRSHVQLDRVVIDHGAATYGAGLALYYSSAAVNNSVFSGNGGYAGNGAFIQAGSAAFTNVSMAHNTGGVGGAVAAYGGATLSLVNVTMSGGAAWDTTGGAYVYPGSAITFDHCNLWGNANGDVGGAPSPIGAGGNISVDPGFADTASPLSIGWDLHLVPLSLLRHAGTPTLQNHDGSVSDIGAYGGPAGDF